MIYTSDDVSGIAKVWETVSRHIRGVRESRSTSIAVPVSILLLVYEREGGYSADCHRSRRSGLFAEARPTDMSRRVGHILSEVTALTYGQFHNAPPARLESTPLINLIS